MQHNILGKQLDSNIQIFGFIKWKICKFLFGQQGQFLVCGRIWNSWKQQVIRVVKKVILFGTMFGIVCA